MNDLASPSVPRERHPVFHSLRSIHHLLRIPWVRFTGVTLVYAAATWAGMALGSFQAHTDLIWPANGVLLGILLLAKRKDWLAYLGATALVSVWVHLHMQFPIGRSCFYAVANVVEIYIAARIITAGEERRPNLVRRKTLFRFLTAVLIAPVFSSIVIGISLYLVYYDLQFGGIHSWYMGDMLGLMMVTPLVLSIRSRELTRLLRKERAVETSVLWATSALASILIFSQTQFPVGFFLFPLVLLTIFRLGITGSAMSVLLLAIPAEYFTVQRQGPFALLRNGSAVEGAILLQLFLGLLIGMVLLIGVVLAEKARLQKRLSESYARMEALAGTDPLTLLANRRTFDLRLTELWARGVREESTLSILMIDVDHFKKYNDSYGHTLGDALLRDIGCSLRSFSRASDIACRYGGEEFSIILPNTDAKSAMEFAVRLRTLIAEKERSDADGALRGVTVSIGVAAMVPDVSTSATSLVAAADHALYEAKATGRNRVCVASAICGS